MKPRLLDLFSGAGGCARGYQRAGFYVIGVDVKPQPRYAGDEFVQDDALETLLSLLNGGAILGNHLDDFAAIHASPPCQDYSSLKVMTTGNYPRLVKPVRKLLRATGLPYVIENVVGAPLLNPIRLCGSSFGLRVWRHRLFEMSDPPLMVPPCSHALHPEPIDVTGTGGPSSVPRSTPGGGLSRKPKDLAEARDAMGIDWMTRPELSEAIPPAFTEHVGSYLLAEIDARSVA